MVLILTFGHPEGKEHGEDDEAVVNRRSLAYNRRRLSVSAQIGE